MKKKGLQFPILVAAIFIFVAFGMSIFMPESLGVSKRRAMQMRHVSPFYRLKVAWQFARFRIFFLVYVSNAIAESVYSIIVIWIMKRYHL